MAQLLVRDLDRDLVVRLKQRAARHNRSTEAEHREILREALAGRRGSPSLKEHLRTMPDVGTDDDFRRSPDKGRRVRL
jgi:plasmid stability protein